MTERSPTLSILLACCLALQGALSLVLPFQSGMAMAAVDEAVEHVTEIAPPAPPCHPAGGSHGAEPAAAESADEPCCDTPPSACSSLCYWACAFTSAPPLAGLSIGGCELPQTPGAALSGTPPPWIPPVPTPPPIQTVSVPA